MSLRAVIFDLYNTLLEVGPPPVDAPARWDRLWQPWGKPAAPLPLAEFDARCREAIRRAHAEARLRGVVFPEVFWPRIAIAAWPELGSWPERQLDAFLDEHAQLQRSVRLMPGAAQTLAALDQRGVLLGLCSNCQPYTLHELRRAFEADPGVPASQDGSPGTARPTGAKAVGRAVPGEPRLPVHGVNAQLPSENFPGAPPLALERFHPQLRFLSFEAGYSKPDLGAFRTLEHALRALGIAPAETLMVGDRLDNDLLPAKAQGWRTWHLASAPVEKPGGTWRQLMEFMAP